MPVISSDAIGCVVYESEGIRELIRMALRSIQSSVRGTLDGVVMGIHEEWQNARADSKVRGSSWRQITSKSSGWVVFISEKRTSFDFLQFNERTRNDEAEGGI